MDWVGWNKKTSHRKLKHTVHLFSFISDRMPQAACKNVNDITNEYLKNNEVATIK